MLTAAGFQIETLENRRIPRPELTPEAAIQFSEASSFGNFLGHLPMELRPQAREEIMLEIEKAGAAATRRERLHIVAIALKP